MKDQGNGTTKRNYFRKGNRVRRIPHIPKLIPKKKWDGD